MAGFFLSTIAEIRAFLAARRKSGNAIGCVPTMGALHAGHAALLDRASGECDCVIATVFVNPLQFDRSEDYERYARSLDADVAFCTAHGVDAVFAPSNSEMYPEPSHSFVEVPDLATHLCGTFRPGHFRGVATVVAKLFNIVQPDKAYFGEKDAQQLAIIERLVRDLNFPIEIVPVATVREPDGLAYSSRNSRLSHGERRAAPVLYRALLHACETITAGERRAVSVKLAARDVLLAEPSVRIEYLDIVDPQTMQPVEHIGNEVRIAIAAWLGTTRLIDNVLCRTEGIPYTQSGQVNSDDSPGRS